MHIKSVFERGKMSKSVFTSHFDASFTEKFANQFKMSAKQNNWEGVEISSPM